MTMACASSRKIFRHRREIIIIVARADGLRFTEGVIRTPQQR
jgi:hypothetical protein